MAVYEKTFDYMSDLIGYLEAAPNVRKEQGKRISHDSNEGRNWCEDNYADSMALALAGYPAGRDKLYEAAGDLASMVKPVSAFRREYDVAGMFPDIPRACGGMPDSMVNIGSMLTQTKKVVKMVYNCTASSRVEADTLVNMGAAVLTAVDELESAGASVELWVAMLTEANSGGGKINMLLKVKGAGEALSIDNAAFPLVHSGFFRRLGFRFIEAQKVKHEQWGAYGRVYDLDEKDCDVYIPGMTDNHNRKECYDMVMDKIRKQLGGQDA